MFYVFLKSPSSSRSSRPLSDTRISTRRRSLSELITTGMTLTTTTCPVDPTLPTPPLSAHPRDPTTRTFLPQPVSRQILSRTRSRRPCSKASRTTRDRPDIRHCIRLSPTTTTATTLPRDRHRTAGGRRTSCTSALQVVTRGRGAQRADAGRDPATADLSTVSEEVTSLSSRSSRRLKSP